jgi:hypothetical protein
MMVNIRGGPGFGAGSQKSRDCHRRPVPAWPMLVADMPVMTSALA